MGRSSGLLVKSGSDVFEPSENRAQSPHPSLGSGPGRPGTRVARYPILTLYAADANSEPYTSRARTDSVLLNMASSTTG